MAIEKKRMQQRGGPYNQFDKSKTLPKEFQFVNSGDPNTSDGRAIYATFESGDPKRLSTYEDMSNDLALALAGLEEEYLGSITQATQNAINATSQASSAATAANQAADEANEIIDAFKEAVDGTVISDSSPSSSTAYSSQKIENDFLKKTGNGSNVTVTFQQAAERAGIQSGDSLAVAFGKLAKFCADLQDYAFSAPVATLTSADSTRPLAASMGKELNDDLSNKFSSINSALTGKIDNLQWTKSTEYVNNFYMGGVSFFIIDSDVAHQIDLPDSSWWYVLHIAKPDNTGFAVQIFIEMAGNGRVCRRWSSESSWTGRDW